MYVTIGRRRELEAGMAGQRPELYQRMLDEIAEHVRFADEAGYAGFGHPILTSLDLFARKVMPRFAGSV
jgi:hypothetical protein